MLNKTVDFDSVQSNKMDRRAGWYENDNGRAIGFPRIEVVQESSISTGILGKPDIKYNFQGSGLTAGEAKAGLREFHYAMPDAVLLSESWDLDTGRLCLWGALEEAYK